MRRASRCRFLRECVPAYSRLRESRERRTGGSRAQGEDSAIPGIAATKPPPGWWVTCATPARGRAAVRARSYINKRSAERWHQKKRRRGTETPLCRAYPALLLQRILTMLERSFAPPPRLPIAHDRSKMEPARMLRTNRRYLDQFVDNHGVIDAITRD